jgi:hypothetical protein
MPNINMEYNEEDIKRLILKDIREKMPGFNFTEKHIDIQVQSKQNYHVHEWEKGKLKIIVDSSKIFAGGI